ncbi:MAG: CHASE domain-containing protein, partial [Caldimonas sp.]
MPLTPAGSLPPLIETGWARLGRPFVLTLLAYTAAGNLSLLIAIPPGYASPLYPAAGIGLASVLVYGRRMLGAVALGSFLVNVVPIAAHGPPGLVALALTAGIALAATLQTGAVAEMVRRLMRQPVTLTLPADVARFMAACTAGSLIAPTLATAMLGAAGIVPGGSLALNWGTWWIGDLSGMLIATPIALTLIGRPRSEWAPRRIAVGLTLALVTAFLGLAIVQMERWNAERVRASFAHDASNASLILMTQLQEPLRALEALRGVFSLSRQPSRAEMHAATENWLGSSAVRAMGWSERVRREDIGAFEARARADGNPGFRVFDRPDSAIESAATAPDRLLLESRAESGDVIAIRQIEPMQGNATALGLNAMSVPAARAAILAAVETGRPAATAGFRLTQQNENDRQIGIVVYHAIYDREVATPADRRTAFRGVVFVSLAMDAQLATLVGKVPAYLDLCVIDGDHLATRRRVAGRAGCDAAPAGLVHGRPYVFAGRQWDLRATARPQDVPEALDRGATFFAAAGLLSAAMLGASLLITTGRTRRIESAVRERTADLRAEVGERHVAEAALRESEQRFRNILDNV